MQLDLFAPFDLLRRLVSKPEAPSPLAPIPKSKAPPRAKSPVREKLPSEQRMARIGTDEIPYVLKRSPQRRRIGLQVDERGLVVMAPWRASDKHIDQVLHEGASWIRKKLANWKDNAPPIRTWQSGDLLDYLGEQLTLSVVPTQERPLVMLLDEHRLEVRSPDPAHTPHVRSALVKWYKRHAQAHFAQRLDFYARELNLRKMPRLFLSSATSRWGSCNAARDIRLSWRLMQAPNTLIDYVVAHEVAHILEMNHSSRFWNIVERLHPDYAHARAELSALTRHYMSL